ncbi:methyltransferase domain-containing protein [Streptomyces synnematoformans]|uniref:methyltransferase domain-containing protein n=1 Tax=Streptomyces synnematoformans TaxID=415721 RepID=UPI003CD0A730
MRVLEIGSGTGWTAGLLAHRLGDANVVTLDVDEDVAAAARGRAVPGGAEARGHHP